MKLFLIAILIIFSIQLIITLIWSITPFRPFKKYCHDILGWHEPNNENKIEFDGVNLHAKCKFCGKDIMKDSQGNWF